MDALRDASPKWLPAASITEHPEYHSTDTHVVELLVMIPGFGAATIGWYHTYGAWMIAGLLSQWPVTHWQPLPLPPKGPTDANHQE